MAEGQPGQPRRHAVGWKVAPCASDATTKGAGLTPDLVFAPNERLPADGRLLVVVDEAADPVEAARRLGFLKAAPDQVDLARPADAGGVEIAPATVASVPLDAGIGPLVRLERRRPASWPPWQPLPRTVQAWSRLAAVALRLVGEQRLVPTLRAVDGTVVACWRALADHDPVAADLVDRLTTAMPPAGHAVSRRADAVWSASGLAAAFLDAVADLCVREAAPPPSDRPRARLLPWTERWREALADRADPSVPLREDEAGELLAGVAAWHQPRQGGDAALALQLHAPDTDDAAWELSFGVRTADGRRIPAEALWDPEHADPALDEGDDVEPLADALLAGLGQLARVFPPVDTALADAEPTRSWLDVAQAWQLIDEVAPLLTGGDVELELPADLTGRPQLRARVDVAADGDGEAPTLDGALDTVAGVQVEVAVDGEAVDPDELLGLLDQDQPLVRWRGRWIPIDDEVRAQLGELQGGSLPLRDALLWALAGSAPLSALTDTGEHRDQAVEVVADGRVGDLLERLEAARGSGRDGALAEIAEPEGFAGSLRPYQRRGTAWLGAMAELGVGGVLADDMGLGKTVQLIAHLLRRGGPGGGGPYLVVCPTSVVGNWSREIARFAPDLPVVRFHGPERPRDLGGVEGVVVTSYGTLRRDPEPLADVAWDVVTLDEAQHVKNPSTAGAKAVRRLQAHQVVGLTGTPLENRLTELWTLLDATNPGLLGSRSRFGRRFVGPIERHGDAAAAERLRRLVSPFVLRRRKDDPEVVGDLPDKLERTVVAPLTAEQAERYQAAVDRVLGQGLEAASAMERRGRVLALLTELKQICNHPAQHAEEPDPVLPGRSGKLAAAREIVAEAVDAGEKLLVFTQFVAMGRLLVRQLSEDLGADIPLLHGGVSAKGRDRMVEDFQRSDGGGAPMLVVSLRAGGTGLNLTAATQVLHYDRWWNPAVEDQATDRAHRIGQHHRVMVHKLVTAGTVEERVASLLERKRALADRIVGAGEEWITELDDDSLAELVSLSAPGEDLDDDGWQPWAEAS